MVLDEQMKYPLITWRKQIKYVLGVIVNL